MLGDSAVNVGIATTAPADKLHLVGNLRFTGCAWNGVTVYAGSCVSDARLKRNVQPFPPVLDKLIQLQPVSFDWKTDQYPERHFGKGRSHGLIAQDVEQVFPELVSEDEQGFKRVNYSELPHLMLQAIRELKADNDRLQKQATSHEALLLEALQAQQAQIRELQSEMGALKTRLGVEVSQSEPRQ